MPLITSDPQTFYIGLGLLTIGLVCILIFRIVITGFAQRKFNETQQRLKENHRHIQSKIQFSALSGTFGKRLRQRQAVEETHRALDKWLIPVLAFRVLSWMMVLGGGVLVVVHLVQKAGLV